MSTNKIAQLAERIQTNVRIIDEYFESIGIPSPTLNVGTPLGYDFPPDLVTRHDAVLADTEELHTIMLGPVSALFFETMKGSPSLQLIVRRKLASSFAADETTTFKKLASISELDEPTTKRLIRHSTSNHIFHEPSEGVIAHTAMSHAIATVPLLDQWIGMAVDQLWPLRPSILAALEKWHHPNEADQCAFNIARNTSKTFFQYINEDAERSLQFKNSMRFMGDSPGFSYKFVVDGYDWASIGNGLVVDVGGSHGAVSLALAEAFESPRFIVQDYSEVIANAAEKLDPKYSGRVEFMAHDFFKPQPVHGADVYFLRWIMHDWSDENAIKILRSLIPALKPGTKIIFNDQCVPGYGQVETYHQQAFREYDMQLIAMQNGKERDTEDWKELISRAAKEFKLEDIHTVKGSLLSMIIVTWMPSVD